MSRVPTTEMTVKAIPSLPEAKEASRFMPKPRPTTEYCNRYLDIFLLNFGKGCPQSSAKAKPLNRATGGVTHEVKGRQAGMYHSSRERVSTARTSL